MSEITQVKYTGSTPGANSNDYTLFDSTAAFSCARQAQMMSVNKAALVLNNSAAGTLKLYYSANRGVTWVQCANDAVGAATATATNDFEWNIESLPDFKIVWTNGGSAQTTWSVLMSLNSDRAAAG